MSKTSKVSQKRVADLYTKVRELHSIRASITIVAAELFLTEERVVEMLGFDWDILQRNI